MLHHNGEEREVHRGNAAPGGSCRITDVVVMGGKEVPQHLNSRLSYLVAPGNRRDKEDGKGRRGKED